MGPGRGRRDQGRAKNRPVYPRDHQARGLRPSPTTPQRGDTPQNQGEGPDPDRPRDENTPHRTGEGDRDDSRPGQEAPEPQTRSDQDGEGVQGAGRWGRARCSRTTAGRPEPRRAKKVSTAARRLLMVAAPRSVAEANRSVKTASSAARSSGRPRVWRGRPVRVFPEVVRRAADGQGSCFQKSPRQSTSGHARFQKYDIRP